MKNTINIKIHATTLTIFLFCLFPFIALAQVSHEISLNVGGGLSTLNYKVSQGKKTPGFGGDVGLGYTCLFHKNIGLLLGADIAFYNAKAKYEGTKVVTLNLLDSEEDRFDMHTTLNKYNETQNAIYVNIPVMLQFQTGVKHKFYALCGVKLGIPVSGKYKVSDATLTNEAYYLEYDNWLKEQEFAGFGTFSNINSNGKQNYKISANVSIEIGRKWSVRDIFAIYTGLYFDYGLMNICKEQHFLSYVKSIPATFTTNSAISKANLMATGIKIRLALPSKTKTSITESKKEKEEKKDIEKLPPVKTDSKEERKKDKEKLQPVKTEGKEKEKINEKQAYISEKQVKKNEKTSNKKEKAPKKKTKVGKQQETSTVNAPVEVITLPVEVELTATAEFTTGRPAHTGFPAFAMGISWVSNIDANTAKFTAANKLVLLQDKAAYDAITTKEKLKKTFDNGNQTNDFTAKGGSLFKPIYFIIQDGEILRLVEMVSIKFKAGESKAFFNERH
ncbi:MAG: PorT family protein [Bacteroidales bacterium]|jgi:hypothetical protein|nr:PorT family protein [Bacteroidales bacterium]